jgi:hypothetical protein
MSGASLVIPHKFAAKRRGLERGRPARLCALGNRISLEGTPRRVGEHLPTRLGVQFKLFWFYYTQRRAGRPRSSPRRFAEIVGYVNNWGVLVLSMRVPPPLSACADVTTRRSVTHLTFADAFWRSVQTCSALLRT